MFKENCPVYMYGKKLEYKQFEYLINRFKEAFSHASLSIEQAFNDLADIDATIESLKDEQSYLHYKTLSLSEKTIIINTVKQIIVFYQKRLGAIEENLDGTQKQVNRIYKDRFTYFNNYILYFLKFDENGKFDRIATLRNMEFLSYKLPLRKNFYDIAYNMQIDNLDAFDYAMKLDEINATEIININTLVNKSDVDKVVGFKKTNNEIFGASFSPVDKESVPREIQKLLYEYSKGFGMEILDPFEANISYEERYKRLDNIFKREAIFHIKFERIHPFNDGNGRTGRIILNFNLMKQGITPVLITDVMSPEYKKYINDFDIDSLSHMFSASSSQLMTNWISLIKGGMSFNKNEINVDNSVVAEIDGFVNLDEGKKRK